MPPITLTKPELVSDARAAMTGAMRHIQSGDERPLDEVIVFCNDSLPQLCLAKIFMLGRLELLMLWNEFHENPDSRFGDNLLGALSIYGKILPALRQAGF